MSHEWDPQNETNYLEEMLNSGVGRDAVSMALAKDAVAYEHEFILAQTLIPFDYEINAEGRWTDSGGKTIEELTDPDDVGADRLDRVLAAERAMRENSSIHMAAVASPDLGYGRSYVYLYSRGEGNSIRALAVEFHGDDEHLQSFFHELGVAGGADVSQSEDFEKPLLLTQTVTPQEILHTVKEHVADTDGGKEYLNRLSRDVSVYPLILHERERQVEEMAAIALDHMLREEDVREGLSAAVYGAIVLAETQVEDTVRHIAEDTHETIVGVVEYVRRRTMTDAIQEEVARYEGITTTQRIEDILVNTDPITLTVITTEPKDESFAQLSIQDQVRVWEQSVGERLQVSETQAHMLYENVTQVWQVFDAAKETLFIAESFGEDMIDISVPAALYVVDVLTLVPYEGPLGEAIFDPGKSVVPEEESAQRHEIAKGQKKDEAILPMQEVPAIPVAIEKTLTSFLEKRPETPLSQQEEAFLIHISDRVDVYVFTKTASFIEQIKDLPVEKQKEAIIVEKQRIQTTLTFLSEQMQTKSQFSKDGLGEGKQEKDRKEISQFSFAVTVWLMLKLSNYFKTLEVLEACVHDLEKSVAKNKEHMGLVKLIKETRPDGLIAREAGQWLLLSIIWHLAMIREQGMQTSKANTKTNKKTRQQKNACFSKAFMPLKGVIFAYSS